MELATVTPTLSEKFTTAYKSSKQRAKEYALKDQSPKLFDHLVKVRILTLFRPKYGLSLDLIILIAGGLFFWPWGFVISILITGSLLIYWARNGMRFIPDGFAEFMGNVLGYSIGITTPRRLVQQSAQSTQSQQSAPPQQPQQTYW